MNKMTAEQREDDTHQRVQKVGLAASPLAQRSLPLPPAIAPRDQARLGVCACKQHRTRASVNIVEFEGSKVWEELTLPRLAFAFQVRLDGSQSLPRRRRPGPKRGCARSGSSDRTRASRARALAGLLRSGGRASTSGCASAAAAACGESGGKRVGTSRRGRRERSGLLCRARNRRCLAASSRASSRSRRHTVRASSSGARNSSSRARG
jgi:hypothetical protein